MYLNTLGKHEIYKSIFEITGAKEQCIKEYILENMEEIVGCHYDDSSIFRMDINNFMEIIGCERLQTISKVVVNHITPRKDVNEICCDGLQTLPHVLTGETSLARYLRNMGLTFEFVDNQVVMKKNNEYVDLRSLQQSNLNARFGDYCSLNDFNVNGYLFVNPFNIDFVRGWLGSPEILKSIATAYGKNSIADDYADQCNNYLVSFDVKIDNVDLEGFSDMISNEYKTELLVKYGLMSLAYYEIPRKPFFQMYNPIIFLKRNYDVQGGDICKTWKFKYERNYLYPEELR